MLPLELNFIPEEIWEKNRIYFRQQRIRWAQVYDEVQEFYRLEVLSE